jgi:hypothetical protein
MQVFAIVVIKCSCVLYLLRLNGENCNGGGMKNENISGAHL